MGNRAVIATSNMPESIGIYLHWNGGRDSVEAFLEYCRLKGYEPPKASRRVSRGFARLCQVIGNFFGGNLSIEIDKLYNLDCNNGDNGLYIIDGWKIVDRKYHDKAEQNEYDLQESLLSIDDAQPEAERIRPYLAAEKIDPNDFKVGDAAVFIDMNGHVQVNKIIGIGQDEWVNGFNVKGVPFVDRWDRGEYEARKNPNNYLTLIFKDVRVLR